MNNTSREYNQFVTKLSEFEQLSRDTGYYHALSIRWDEYTPKYESLRNKQSKMFTELTEMFPKEKHNENT